MNKLPLEPNITMGDSFMFSLKAWARNVASAFNAAVDGIATKAPIDSATLTGTPTAPTPPVPDNSTRIVTTAWVHSAMASIATAAGFVVSFGTVGYIKLPSWLGSFVLQWGLSSPGGAGSATIAFPLTFPTGCRAVVTTFFNAALSAGTLLSINVTATTASNFSILRRFYNGGSVGDSGDALIWIAVGE